MKKIKKVVLLVGLFSGVMAGGFFYYKRYMKKPEKPLFRTEKPIKKTISHIIDATGKLKAKDHLKIGSYVSGIVSKIHVEENQKVNKGDLLATIDNGIGDIDVKGAKASLDKAKVKLCYQKNRYERFVEMYKNNQISEDLFEKENKDYREILADVEAYQADLERKVRTFENTKIKAPGDGIIVRCGVTRGERVSTDLNAVTVFDMASGLDVMNAHIEVDESDMSGAAKGKKVKLRIDGYPNRTFKGVVDSIKYSASTKDGRTFFETIVALDNKDRLLRHGMSVEATIFVDKKKDVLSISNQAFYLDDASLEKIAEKINYSVAKIEDRSPLKFSSQDVFKKTAWIKKDGKFVEKIVTLGITDDTHFEVVEGLSEEDEVIVDIDEANVMEEFYKKMFAGPF